MLRSGFMKQVYLLDDHTETLTCISEIFEFENISHYASSSIEHLYEAVIKNSKCDDYYIYVLDLSFYPSKKCRFPSKYFDSAIAGDRIEKVISEQLCGLLIHEEMEKITGTVLPVVFFTAAIERGSIIEQTILKYVESDNMNRFFFYKSDSTRGVIEVIKRFL